MAQNEELKTAMKNAYIDLQVKRNTSDVLDQFEIDDELEKLSNEIARLNIELLKEGTIVTDADMQEMAEIKKEIDAAADKQQLIASIGKAVGFIAKKLM
jgi:DNA gyrase/topoisomerase IV subunit A